MEIKYLPAPSVHADVDLLGVLCHEDTLDGDPVLQDLDARLHGLLRTAATEERFLARPGQTLSLHTHGGIPARRLVIIGCGPASQFSAGPARVAAGRFARVALA